MSSSALPPYAKPMDPHDAKISAWVYAMVHEVSAVMDRHEVPEMHRSEALEQLSVLCTYSPET